MYTISIDANIFRNITTGNHDRGVITIPAILGVEQLFSLKTQIYFHMAEIRTPNKSLKSVNHDVCIKNVIVNNFGEQRVFGISVDHGSTRGSL